MAVWDLENAAHLLRRAGFGGTPEKIQDFLDRHNDVASAVDELLSFKPSKSKPPSPKTIDDDDKLKMQRWWIKTMIAKTKVPHDACREKLVLFLHHFLACGASKQPELRFMSLQNRLFRLNAKGNFKNLIREFNRDPANLYYLDGILNDASQGQGAGPGGTDIVVANENFGRELMELFTLGVFQFASDGSDDPSKPNYDESDVHNVARACTGWTDIDGELGVWNQDRWDGGQYDDDGDGSPDPIVIFGQGNDNFRIDAGVAGTSDDILEVIFSRTDDAGNNQVAMFVARKLWEWYAYPPPSAGLKAILAGLAATFEGSGFELDPLLRALWSHDEFYSVAAKSRTVKNPVDYVVQAFKAFGAKSNGKEVGYANSELGDHLARMGMDLFEPPNVAGWPGGNAWINSGTLLERLGFARDLTVSDFGPSQIRLDRIDGLPIGSSSADPTAVMDVILDHVGLSSGPLALSTAQRNVLLDFLTDNGGSPTLDLSDAYTNDAQLKVKGLIGLVLQAAESQVF